MKIKQQGTAVIFSLLVLALMTSFILTWHIANRVNLKQTFYFLQADQALQYNQISLNWAFSVLTQANPLNFNTKQMITEKTPTNETLRASLSPYKSAYYKLVNPDQPNRAYYLLRTSITNYEQSFIMYSLIQQDYGEEKPRFEIIWQVMGI